MDLKEEQLSTDSTFRQDLHDCFEIVYERVTQGRHDMKRLKGYLEDRAKAEAAYAATVLKAVQLPDFETSTSLSQCWKDIRRVGNDQGTQHEAFGKTCLSIAQALGKMIVEVKQTKTKLMESYQKLLKEKQNRRDQHNKAKASYYDSVKQAETAVINRSQGRSQNLPEKQIQKLESKAKDSIKAVEVAHVQYKKSVDELKKAEENYDMQTAEMLAQFEELECRRMKLLQEQMQFFSQSHEFIKSNLEQIHMFLSRSCESVNIKKDVLMFIKEKKTGKSREEHVVYLPLRSTLIDHNPGNLPASSTMNGVTVTPPSMPSTASSSASSSLASSSSLSSSSSSSSAKAVALYDFPATEAEDLAFSAGETIELEQYPDNEDWWRGRIGARSGIFPKAYVQLQSSSASSPLPPAASSVASPPPPAAAAEEPGQGESPQAPKMLQAKCRALYDFPGGDQDELSFTAGEELQITGELDGWYLGKSLDGSRVGIFPSNYVEVL